MRQVIDFPDLATRNAWLDLRYPEREFHKWSGRERFYLLANGNIDVDDERVTIYDEDREEPWELPTNATDATDDALTYVDPDATLH